VSRMRGRRQSPLSLFSFQDIITSITGIMILVVMMLVLQVVRQKSREASAETRPETASSVIQSEISTLRAKKQRLAREVETRQAAVSRLLEADPQQLEQRLRQEQDKLARLRTRLAELNVTLDQRRKGSGKAGRNTLLDEQERKRLKERLARLQRENRVTFEFEQAPKTPVLVQCSGKSIEVKLLDEPPSIESFSSPEAGHAAFSARFQQWAAGLKREQCSFVVLVKPSSAEYAVQVINALHTAGFDVGYEPLEEERTAVFADEPLL